MNDKKLLKCIELLHSKGYKINPTNYYKKLEKDITKNAKKSFEDFFATIDTLDYFYEMRDNTGKYDITDIIQWDYKKNLDKSVQRSIERQSFLTTTYKYLNENKTEKEITDILEKYETWFYVLIKKIYKKYIDKDYEIETYNDGEGDNEQHIIM